MEPTAIYYDIGRIEMRGFLLANGVQAWAVDPIFEALFGLASLTEEAGCNASWLDALGAPDIFD